MKSIPKDVVPDILDDYESIMHESVGREIQFDPSFRNDEICVNPFVLVCWLTGCTVFVTKDQLPLRVASTSRDDGTFWVGLFPDSLF